MSGRFLYTVFCDDVRQEVNGKFLAIGVYGGEINVPGFPWFGAVASLVLIEGVSVGQHKAAFELRSQRGAVFGSLAFDLSTVSVSPAMLGLPPIPFQLSGPEDLQLWGGIDGSPLQLCGSIQATSGPMSTNTAAPSKPTRTARKKQTSSK